MEEQTVDVVEVEKKSWRDWKAVRFVKEHPAECITLVSSFLAILAEGLRIYSNVTECQSDIYLTRTDGVQVRCKCKEMPTAVQTGSSEEG